MRTTVVLAWIALGTGLALDTRAQSTAESEEVRAPSAEPEELKQRFAEAVKLFKEQRAAEALPAFREVAATTNSPNAHLYVARCLVALGRHVEAHAAFSRTLAVVTAAADPKYEPTRDAAVLQLAELDARVAKLVISFTEVPSGLVVTVDGAALEPARLGSTLVLEPGAHRVEASATDRAPISREVAIAPGEMKTLALALAAESEPAPAIAAPAPVAPRRDTSPGGARSPFRTLGFVASGVGVAGLATFAVAGLSAKSTHDELESDCPNGCSDAAHRDDVDRGKRLQTVANVGLVVGLVGVVAGGTLLYLGFATPSESAGSARAAGTLELVRDGAVLSYRSAF